MKRLIVVTLTQAEANALSSAAAERMEQYDAGDLDGLQNPQRLAAQDAAIRRARSKLFVAGMDVNR